MSSWRNSNNGGQSSSSREMQDFDQQDNNNFTYPDPTVHTSQAFPRHQGTYRRILPRHNESFQTRSPNADVIQRDSYQMPEPIQQSVSAMHNFGTEQIGWGDQYNALYFLDANMPSQTTNTVPLNNINTQGYPSTFATQHTSSLNTRLGYNSGHIHHTNRPTPYQAAPPGVTPGLCYPAPRLPTSISNSSAPTERVRRYPRRERKNPSKDNAGPVAERLALLNEKGHRPQTAAKRHRSLTQNRAAPTVTQQPGQSKPSNALGASRTGNGRRGSRLEQRGARRANNMGFDRRPRAQIRMVDGKLWALVDDEWSRAAHHHDFRKRFLIMASQQPGATVWEEGMSEDYTSYSPLTQGWNNDMDVSTVRDSKGRQVFLMPEAPTDYTPKPRCGYLMFEGLFILDDNNRPIKDYPGAPLTLSTQAPACLMEALRRVLGMTIFDLMSRMPAQRKTSSGVKDLQESTAFSNRLDRWMKKPETKAKGVRPWFERTKGQATEEGAYETSDLSDEEADMTEPMPDRLTVDPGTIENSHNNLYRLPASLPDLSVAGSASHNLPRPELNHSSLEDAPRRRQSWGIDPQLLVFDVNRLSGAHRNLGVPEISYSDIEHITGVNDSMDCTPSSHPSDFPSSSPGNSAAVASSTGLPPIKWDVPSIDWNDPAWDIGPSFPGSGHP